jgi:hypothetical protein
LRTRELVQLHFPLLWLIPAAVAVLLAIAFLPLLAPFKQSPPDERFWKSGIFYVNPHDPALFVRKHYRAGYTLNFGNPWSWPVLALILLLATAPIVFAVTTLMNIRRLAR